jgi:hypothetical protein
VDGARSSDVRTTDSFPTAQSLDGLDELLNAERPDDLIAARFNLVSGQVKSSSARVRYDSVSTISRHRFPSPSMSHFTNENFAMNVNSFHREANP